jgi:hypothetical protein
MNGKALLVVLLLALFIVRPVYPQQLTAAQAKNHEGETATVCGVVASEHTASSSRGRPTFINLDAPYPNQVFTILVWGEDRRNIGALPQSNSRICVAGSSIRQLRTVSFARYGASGNLLAAHEGGKWESSIPDTLGETLLNDICTANK